MSSLAGSCPSRRQELPLSPQCSGRRKSATLPFCFCAHLSEPESSTLHPRLRRLLRCLRTPPSFHRKTFSGRRHPAWRNVDFWRNPQEHAASSAPRLRRSAPGFATLISFVLPAGDTLRERALSSATCDQDLPGRDGDAPTCAVAGTPAA